jgi:RND family efflux transporter MFP subunit
MSSGSDEPNAPASIRRPAVLRSRTTWLGLLGLAAVAAGALAWLAAGMPGRDTFAQDAGKPSQKDARTDAHKARPSLTVETVLPEIRELPMRISASGNVAAWQEALISAEVSGLRLTEVRVNVGDVVKAGALLATFSSDTVVAELALQRAALAEAEAAFAEARDNANRARQVQATGALSAQQVGQFLTAESTAKARVDAARAQVQSQELRLKYTRVEAPDSGIISARGATVGAVAQPGQELFRLIRQGRLEWRAEVPAAELHRVRVGQPVGVVAPSGAKLDGRVRMVGPTVDNSSRNALVYVDLRTGTQVLKPGMFVRGEIDMGASRALTLPQSAVLLREGFSYVYRIGADDRVIQTKVDVGRREGDRIEIASGLAPDVRVVRSGVAFLADGDTVRVVEKAPGPAAATAGSGR